MLRRPRSALTPMNAVEIEQAISDLALQPFDAAEFPFAFLAAFGNARGRSTEVAILRAIGYRASQVLALFLFRSLAGGLLGAAVGCAAGLLIAVQLRGEFAVPIVGPAAGLPLRPQRGQRLGGGVERATRPGAADVG